MSSTRIDHVVVGTITRIQDGLGTPPSRARLAALRRAAMLGTASTPASWEDVLDGLTQGASLPSTEVARHLLGLYARHQQMMGTKPAHVSRTTESAPGEGTLGALVLALEKGGLSRTNADGLSSARRRFGAVVSAPSLEVAVQRARSLVEQGASLGLTLDYGLLTRQLRTFDMPKEVSADARARLAASYFEAQIQR